MKRKSYPTDLTDTEWDILEPLIPKAGAGGRPRSVDMREIINAIFYVLRGGIPWRMLPHDLPRCKTVYHLLVDTEGLLLKVKAHEAGMSDSAGAKMVVEGLSGRFPRMRKVWADYAADLRSG